MSPTNPRTQAPENLSTRAPEHLINAMTIDVEDYFQVSAFDAVVRREDWGAYPSHVVKNTERLLAMFDSHGVKATFFVLGWVADRFPSLVRSIAAEGHELASHGHLHRIVYSQTPAEFREDVRRAKRTIEDAGGQPVAGYRAPSFSITKESLWALDVLVEEGYAYDASIFPVRHDRYGIPDAPRHPHTLDRAAGRLLEAPPSTVRLGTTNLPVAGGGYFRLLPYQWTRWGIARINRVERKPAIFYLHPWEIDPNQPRLKAPMLSRFRHYRNLARTESRLNRLLSDFKFGTLRELLVGTTGTTGTTGTRNERPLANHSQLVGTQQTEKSRQSLARSWYLSYPSYLSYESEVGS